MATVARDIAASPEQVWEVLADGWELVAWVVGAWRMRAVDDDWPGVGSRLHHSVGMWPLLINDDTQVLECEPSRRLVLQARAWPVGEARVELELAPIALPGGRPGCRVTMHEKPDAGPGLAMLNRVGDALLAKRNVESLARLAAIAEGKHARRRGQEA